MIKTLAITNYRSLLNLVVPLGRLNVVTGSNGSGKSNLYKALRLLADTAGGDVISALAKQGGLDSVFWAGPENISRKMLTGEARVEGNHKKKESSILKLGFSGEGFGYAISIGFPPPPFPPIPPDPTKFLLDPEIKKEVIWVGSSYRPASSLIERHNNVVKCRKDNGWQIVSQHINGYDSMLSEFLSPSHAPEIFHICHEIKAWRFYDYFRTDKNAQTRRSQIGTRSPVLDHDGHNLAAALQTIIEIGDHQGLHEAINDAFPGASLKIDVDERSIFSVQFYQHGLLRPLSVAELSDGTLRYLLLVTALLSPRPPGLMVLNEPENSLHPDLLPVLAKLIIKVSQSTQVWVVSHDSRLVSALEKSESCNSIHLDKKLGQTTIQGQDLLDTPTWHWPKYN